MLHCDRDLDNVLEGYLGGPELPHGVLQVQQRTNVLIYPTEHQACSPIELALVQGVACGQQVLCL